MRRLTLHSLWQRKRRAAGTALAIILGVAFLTATLTLGDTLDASFSSVFRQANDGTAVVVRGARSIDSDAGAQRAPIPASTADRVRAVPGVAAVAAEVQGTAQVVGTDGDPVGGDGPPTAAHAWIDDDVLNPFQVTQGRAPRRPGEAVVDRAAAKAGHLRVGQSFTLRTPDAVRLRLVGVVSFGTEPTMGGSTYIGLAPRQASQLFATPGTIDELRVRGDGTRTDAELREAVGSVLPSSARAITGTELTREQRAEVDATFGGAVKVFLLAFAGVAVVVATFSIANTFAIVAAQRSRESALLRAIGASKRQVLLSVLGESLLVGAAATLVGLAVGIGLSFGLRALLTSFGLDLAGTGLVVTGSTLVAAAVVGMASTLIAALLPAIRSARTSPMEALRDTAAEVLRTSRVRGAAGVLVTGVGATVVVLAANRHHGAVAQAGLGSLLVLVGTVLLGAVIARPAAAAIGAPIAATRGVPGRLARRNAMRNPRRTAGAALALVIGAAVVALFATFGSSLRLSIDQSVDRSFGGDLVLAQSNFSGVPISPKVGSSVAALPEVSHVATISNAVAKAGGATVYPNATQPAELDALVDLDVARGSVARLRPGQVAVSSPYARTHHLTLGSPLAFTYPDGKRQTLHVAATYRSVDLLGDLVMHIDDWTPHTTQPGDVAVLVSLRPGVSLEQGRAAVERVAHRYGAPAVEDRQQYVDRVAGQVDQILVLVYGLLALAVLIALIGLANTLSLSIHERTRELGLLRALGLSRSGLRSSVRWESVVTAVVGTVLGLGVGTFLGWGLVRALNAQVGFISFQAPGSALVVVLVLSITAGVVAAIRPARRAARLDVLGAIAER